METESGHCPGSAMSMDRNPFRSLEAQFEQLRRQFETMLEQIDGEEFDMPMDRSAVGIDLADREDEYVLTADVPGFERDEIDVRLADDTVHITAERERVEHEETDEQYLRNEREHRTVRRAVRLPGSVVADEVEATCRNGVLTITLPKEEPGELEGRKIDVESAD